MYLPRSILGAPLLLGNDIRSMDNFTLSLLTAAEVIAVDQDPGCVQGSISHIDNATEVWVKPLSTGNFAAVLFNQGQSAAPVTLYISPSNYNSGDFYPASFHTAHIRDLYTGADLGVFKDTFTATVDAMDAMIVLVEPL